MGQSLTPDEWETFLLVVSLKCGDNGGKGLLVPANAVCKGPTYSMGQSCFWNVPFHAFSGHSPKVIEV